MKERVIFKATSDKMWLSVKLNSNGFPKYRIEKSSHLFPKNCSYSIYEGFKFITSGLTSPKAVRAYIDNLEETEKSEDNEKDFPLDYY